MIETLFNNFMTASVVVGFLFIIATQFSKYRYDKPIVYLNLFILSFTLYNFQRLLIINKIVFVNYFIVSLPITFYALIVPFFYTFTTHYLGIEKKVKSFLKISIGLFLLQTIIRALLFPKYFNLPNSIVVAEYTQYEEIFNALFSVYLYSKTFYFVFFKQDLYQEVLSFDNIDWIKKFMLVGALVLTTWVLAILFNINNVITPYVPLYYPLRLSTFILLCWLGYHGFYNYSLLTERILLRKEIAQEIEVEKDTPTIGTYCVTEKPIDSDFLALNEFIIQNKLYTNPNLSIEEVAKAINITPRKITQIVQKSTNFNFADYVNHIRVEKAKKYLLNPKYEKYTNLSIGFECGFNSKSTFYRAFAKFTSTTPTLFKQQSKS
jgi:AraC-like DNA-binding protein